MYFSRWFLAAISLLGLLTATHAQRPLYNQQQRLRLETLRKEITQSRNLKLAQAIQVARRRNLPLEQVRSDGTVVILSGIDENQNLLYDATYSATRAGQTTRTSSLYAGGGMGLSLNGSSAAVRNKLGIWDGGRVLNTHVELVNRVTQVDNPSRTDNHATHVAGILIGTGINSLTRGMAFGANLRAWDFNSDDPEMIAAAPDLLVSNHSYGTQSGWVFNSDRAGTVKWEWYGDTTISATEDHKFGLYNFEARDWDRTAYNAPYYLIVKSAGNNHALNGPGADQPYFLINRGTVSKTPRNDQNGYDQISTYGTAKNILLVGAVSSISPEYTQPSDVRIASFSSWGPTDDGRIKPDIVGVGVSVLSAGSASDATYTILSGTSMSSPNVAGSLLLLQEYYNQQNGGRFMRSSTLRGLAIHTADEAGTAPGPDYRFGWGLLNTERAARVLGNTDRSHLLEERTLVQNQSQTVRLTASGRGPLVVTICWTDPEGTPSVSGSNGLNDRIPKLVNDLDIRLTEGSNTFQPWVLNPTNPAQAAQQGDNSLDNVEQIRIERPVPGVTYTLTITHKGSLRNNQQDFALIASGVGGTTYCSSASSGPAGAQIGRVRFAGIDQEGANGCQTNTIFTSAVATVAAGQRLPLDITTASCGGTRPTIVKAFADWNLDGDFADSGEQIAVSGQLQPGVTFSTTVTIPSGVTIGTFTRLRIVASEAGSADQVLPCGIYAVGETQEYLIQFSRPQNDIGVVALLSPQSGFCVQNELAASVRLRNFGLAQQTTLPVTIQVIQESNNMVVATLTETFQRTLPSLQETEVTLRGTVQFQYGQSYRFVASTTLPTDQDESNNLFSESRATAEDPATQGRFTASYCSENVISLQNLGSGTAFWYDAAQNGSLIGVGNQLSTSRRTTNNVYYATLNDFSGTVGPATKQQFRGGGYGPNFGPQPLITTRIPLRLESARLYIGSPGQITFTVRKLDESVVSTVTLNVTATRSPAGNQPTSELADDPNDQGAEYPLNLSIPEPGDYKITIDYANGASIYRSNQGVSGFPFEIPGVVSIRGSLFRNSNNQVDTLRAAYYYLYNLQVRSLGCPLIQRTAVTAQSVMGIMTSLTAAGSTSICQGETVQLVVPSAASVTYQWLRNGQVIPNATASTYNAGEAGVYSVVITSACAPVTSNTLAVSVKEPQRPVITRNGYTLTSNAPSGNQWFRDSVSISGAINPVLQVTQSGRYTVRAAPNGCTPLVSEAVFVEVITGLEPGAEGRLRFFPTPATEYITIEYTLSALTTEPITARLTDARGIPLKTVVLPLQGQLYRQMVTTNDCPPGVIFVTILKPDGTALRQGHFLKL